VFVLSSNPTDDLPGDEDQIPPNGNPHPVNPHFLHQMNPQGENLGFFEDVGDLDNIQQDNIDHGWEAPQAGDQQDNMQGWGQWIQQEGEQVDENVLAAVDQLAEVAMANAVANGIMQAPDFPQHSVTVNSETNVFFRAQGSPITLELPLPEIGSDRTLALSDGSLQSFSNDYSIRELAARLNIHAGFGPAPSVEMLLQELARSVPAVQASLPMKSPLPHSSWNNITMLPELDPWFLNMDNLNWGNNAEASSSAGPRLCRLQLLEKPFVELQPDKQLVLYNQDFARMQILKNLHPPFLAAVPSVTANSDGPVLVGQDPPQPISDGVFMEIEVDKGASDDQGLGYFEDGGAAPTDDIGSPSHISKKKRKSRPKTPIVDDEVRRSSRLRKESLQLHVHLDNEPRKKPGEARKSVSFSTVEDLKTAIICRSLDNDLEVENVDAIESNVIQQFGICFCGIPPVEFDAEASHTPED
jgi:hypothetical protein